VEQEQKSLDVEWNKDKNETGKGGFSIYVEQGGVRNRSRWSLNSPLVPKWN